MQLGSRTGSPCTADGATGSGQAMSSTGTAAAIAVRTAAIVPSVTLHRQQAVGQCSAHLLLQESAIALDLGTARSDVVIKRLADAIELAAIASPGCMRVGRSQILPVPPALSRPHSAVPLLQEAPAGEGNPTM